MQILVWTIFQKGKQGGASKRNCGEAWMLTGRR